MARKTPEGRFKDILTKDLERLFPGCVILKNDEQLCQGIPDMLVLWRDKYAMLELKRSATAIHEPNQDWYIDKFANWSFGAFVYPENKEEVLHELQQAFRPYRTARVPQRQ